MSKENQSWDGIDNIYEFSAWLIKRHFRKGLIIIVVSTIIAFFGYVIFSVGFKVTKNGNGYELETLEKLPEKVK